MNWIAWATTASLSDVAYHMGYKAASTRMSGLLYILILNLSICFFCLLGLAIQKGRGQPITMDMSALWIPLLLGFVVMTMEFGIYMMYAKGAPFTLANPFMTVTIDIMTIFTGFFLYKERLDWMNYAGALMCLAGAVLMMHNQR